jgi:hypothetical protein
MLYHDEAKFSPHDYTKTVKEAKNARSIVLGIIVTITPLLPQRA